MFHDLEAKGRNWYKELPSVPWALCTNINRAIRDIPFNLVYGADAVLPPKIYLESTRVAHFNAKDQAEVRELDSNLLEERCNTTLANVQVSRITEAIIQQECRPKRDQHRELSTKEGPFIIVDIAALGAYVLTEVDGGMLPNTWNAD
jgi:hypothetical protein